MYAEDLELCWRLARDGWRIELVAEVVVPHVGNAAGAQAWGSERDRRWWGATYDLYARERGVGAMRRWAVVNTAGVLLHLASNRAGALLPGAGRARRRHTAAALRAVLPVHRAALRGPERALEVSGAVVRPDDGA
jgi:GT2 family glycosyltransferase